MRTALFTLLAGLLLAGCATRHTRDPYGSDYWSYLRGEQIAASPQGQTIDGFLWAGQQGDPYRAARFVTAESGLVSPTGQIRVLPGMDRSRIIEMYAGRHEALAIGSPFSDKRGRRGQLIYRLVNDRGRWLISGVDFQVSAGVRSEIDRWKLRQEYR